MGNVLLLNRSTLTSRFPLRPAPNGRYLVDSWGQPYFIAGRALWNIVGLDVASYQSVLQDTAAKGFTAIEFRATCHSDGPASPGPPKNGNGDLPWSGKLGGGSYTGLTDTPDFTTPNNAYWDYVGGIIDYAASLGLQCHVFPSYIGYSGGTSGQGFGVEMAANGQTNMQTFGAYVANRWKLKPNICWMILGDDDAASGTLKTAHQGLVNGLQSVSTVSTLYAAEPGSYTYIKADANWGSYCNFDSCYAFDGTVGAKCGSAYGFSPTCPAFLIEGPYDEEGPDGTNVNAAATQPVRRFQYYASLRGIGGYVTGNGYVWSFDTGYSSHLNSTGAQDLARLNALVKSLPWHRLIPDGLGTMGTLITAGGGTIDTTSYATAAATPEGDLLIAYLGPGTAGSVTISMTAMRGTATARWWDPTNATYTGIGSIANSGTHTFTTPGNNSAGAADWVLRLDA